MPELMQPIAVVVRILDRNGKVAHRSIHRFPSESLIKPFRKYVKQLYSTAETYMINVRDAAEPQGTPQRGKLWCPYCSEYRSFLEDTRLGYVRCEVCGISTRDFYVQTYNHLWPSLKEVKRNGTEDSGTSRKKKRK